MSLGVRVVTRVRWDRADTRSEIVKQSFFGELREISRSFLDDKREVIHVTSVVSMRSKTFNINTAVTQHRSKGPRDTERFLLALASPPLCFASHANVCGQRLAYCCQSIQIETALKLPLLTMRNFGRKLVDKARSALDIAHPSQPPPSGVTQLHPQSVQNVNISGNIISERSQ